MCIALWEKSFIQKETQPIHDTRNVRQKWWKQFVRNLPLVKQRVYSPSTIKGRLHILSYCWFHHCTANYMYPNACTWTFSGYAYLIEAEWCVSKHSFIGSENGLTPGRSQAIIWTNARILLIGPFGTNFSEIFIEIRIFHPRKRIWKCRLRFVGHFVSASMCYMRICIFCKPKMRHTLNILLSFIKGLEQASNYKVNNPVYAKQKLLH